MNNEIISSDTVGRLGSRVLSASTLNDDDVYNLKGEKLGSIKEAPGFDTDNWTNLADATREKKVHSYYGTQPITTF